MGKKQKKPGLLDVLLSMLIDPRGVTRRLFAAKGHYPWVFTTFILFICTCIVAPVIYKPGVDYRTADTSHLAPLLTATGLTVACTTFFLMVGLHALNVRRSPYSVFSALVYASAPFTTTLASLLVADKILFGDLFILGFLATGFAPEDDFLAKLFPVMMLVASSLSLIILSQSIRAISRSSLSVAVMMGVATIPLLLGSFVVALTITDFAYPRSSPSTIQFFSNYVGLSSLP